MNHELPLPSGPRIVGDLGRLLGVLVYMGEDAHLGRAPYERARRALQGFLRHVSLSEAELRAVPYAGLSFDLHYRVFHVLLYLADISPRRNLRALSAWHDRKTTSRT